MPIKIAAQQETLLKQLTLEGYMTELVEYSQQVQPELLGRLREEKLRKILKVVHDQAGISFGFDERGSIHLYVDLIWGYGWDFENDPQYPWVMQTKEQNKAHPQIKQATILFKEMENYKKSVWGNAYQHRKTCIEKFQTLDVHALRMRDVEFVPDLLVILHDLAPQKYERSGEQALKQLITEGRDNAVKVLGFQKLTHQGLVVILAFLLGHAFYRNPFYDWPEPEVSRDSADENAAATKMEIFAQYLLAEEFETYENDNDRQENQNGSE